MNRDVWAAAHHRLQLVASEEGEQRHRDHAGDALPHGGHRGVKLVQTGMEGEAHILRPVVSCDPAVPGILVSGLDQGIIMVTAVPVTEVHLLARG